MTMATLLQGIAEDLRFIRSHSLQPKWYKALKAFILLGFLLSYWAFFGLKRTAIFLSVFLLLSLGLHLLYRAGTHGWKRSWLDFVVAEQQGEIGPQRIGIFYYVAIVMSAGLSVVASQLLA
jgi:hypothetical protein